MKEKFYETFVVLAQVRNAVNSGFPSLAVFGIDRLHKMLVDIARELPETKLELTTKMMTDIAKKLPGLKLPMTKMDLSEKLISCKLPLNFLEEAVEIVSKSSKMVVTFSREINKKGGWALAAEANPEFWLGHWETLDEAMSHASKFELPIDVVENFY